MIQTNCTYKLMLEIKKIRNFITIYFFLSITSFNPFLAFGLELGDYLGDKECGVKKVSYVGPVKLIGIIFADSNLTSKDYEFHACYQDKFCFEDNWDEFGNRNVYCRIISYELQNDCNDEYDKLAIKCSENGVEMGSWDNDACTAPCKIDSNKGLGPPSHCTI